MKRERITMESDGFEAKGRRKENKGVFITPTQPPSSEPTTVNDIAHSANLAPILFNSEEEEELLPPNL